MSGFTFVPAVREQVSMLIGLAGASGSGKTKTALLLAEGMSPAGRIAFIDTEARRGLHYADDHKFLHAPMAPPFRPERFVEALDAAERSGAEVGIFDSFSHEYDGEGGILDWASELEHGAEGVSGVKPPGNWKMPKLAHKKMMGRILQSPMSLIFCLRADEKIEIAKEEFEGSNGKTYMKTVVRPLGWMPICEKRFMFEMTASFTLRPDRPGIPQFDLPHKLQAQHRPMFPDGQQIGRDAGAALAAWARGGAPAAAGAGQPLDEATLDGLEAQGYRAACDGPSALESWWKGLAKDERAALGKARIDAWKDRAAKLTEDAHG